MKQKNILYGLIIFNILLSVFAASLFIFGVVITFKGDLQGKYPLPFNDYAIIGGAIIFSICVFGCHALHKRSKFLILTYVGILTVFFTFQTIIGIMGFIKIQDENLLYKEICNDLEEKFYNWDYTEISGIQKTYKCCGIYGPSDYFRTRMNVFPKSCCKADKEEPCFVPDYQDGCGRKILELFELNAKSVGTFSIGLSIIQLILALFTFYHKKYLMDPNNNVSKA